jgi:ATP-dependent helicase/nuclease subunit A
MQQSLFDAALPAPHTPPDQAARDFAVDPGEHVVLEASAGTGKTRVLVDRYVRLVSEKVSPRNILAITFTRKAAAEMRERILERLRPTTSSAVLADIQITTIDAFCYGLLREFPLEADVDPGFEIADETEMARFAAEALDVTFRIARGVVADHEPLRLLFTRVKAPVLRMAVARLLDRRHVAVPAVNAFVQRAVARRTAADVAQAFSERLRAAIGGQPALVADGPHGAAAFRWVADDLRRLLESEEPLPVPDVPHVERRLSQYFLTKEREPRKRLVTYAKVDTFASPAAKKRHEAAVAAVAPAVQDALTALERDVDGLLALGLQAMLAIAVKQYQRLLDDHAVLDFAGMLDKAVALLERQEEFARSRLKLQSRYHHLLLDEFQDTSRQQWRLVDLLIAAWGEGQGLVDRTSIFIVGDRKQSIYRFRHAEVVLLDEATRRIGALRPGRRVRQAISTNFRSVAPLLSFVNALSASMEGDPTLDERFAYRETDRFPVTEVGDGALYDGAPVLGIVAERTLQASAEAVASEIAGLLARLVVRDKDGPPRPVRPDDMAILFRARAGHQVFEEALERRGIQTYVYKGLGFFDAPEVQDLQALLRYLAEPESDLRAAELLRSRFVRLSDEGIARLAPDLARALNSETVQVDDLPEVDRALFLRARDDVRRWVALADRMSAGALLDRIMRESAYAAELQGRRTQQARENIKKVRALVRRVENRGYATLGRLAAYFETLRAGDESNAVVEARGCVNLMTIHAAKGLEFPVVFVVNLQAPGRGRHQGISVIERSVDGEPEVAFRSTDGTKLEDRREAEELRRLLYVAVTRARDRLYLAAQVDDHGELKPAARSLARLFPASLIEVFSRAAREQADTVEWMTPGQRYVCRVGRAEVGRAEALPHVRECGRAEALPHVRECGRAEALPRVLFRVEPASALVAAAVPVGGGARARGEQAGAAGRTRTEERVAGTIVHRLLEWAGGRRPDVADFGRAYDALVRPEMLVDVDLPAAFRHEVIAAAAAIQGRTMLSALLGAGDCWYEVPCSWTDPERPDVVVRGTIDCLVRTAEGWVVVEIKTGAPRPEHQAQLSLYVAAVQALHRGVPVRGELVYPPPEL